MASPEAMDTAVSPPSTMATNQRRGGGGGGGVAVGLVEALKQSMSEVFEQAEAFPSDYITPIDIDAPDSPFLYFTAHLSCLSCDVIVKVVPDDAADHSLSSFKKSQYLFPYFQPFILRPLFHLRFSFHSSSYSAFLYDSCDSFDSFLSGLGFQCGLPSLLPVIRDYLDALSALVLHDKMLNCASPFALVVSNGRGRLMEFGDFDPRLPIHNDFLHLASYLSSKFSALSPPGTPMSKDLVFLIRHLQSIQAKYQCAHFNLFPIFLSDGAKLYFMCQAYRLLLTRAAEISTQNGTNVSTKSISDHDHQVASFFDKRFRIEADALEALPPGFDSSSDTMQWSVSISHEDLRACYTDSTSTYDTSSPGHFLRFVRDANDRLSPTSVLACNNNELLFGAIDKVWPGFVYVVYRVLLMLDLIRRIHK